MAANLLSVTVTSINGVIPIGTYTLAINKGRANISNSLNAGADTQINLVRNWKVNTIENLIVSDNYSVIKTALVTNAYTAGKVAEIPVSQLGATVYPVTTNVLLSVDSMAYAQANPSDANKSIIIYEDPSQGEVKVYADMTLVALITATTT